MKEACNEICSKSTGYTEEDDNIIMDTGVTLDGTWQKRGFISYNGAGMAISINTGKILDLGKSCLGTANIVWRYTRKMILYFTINLKMITFVL